MLGRERRRERRRGPMLRNSRPHGRKKAFEARPDPSAAPDFLKRLGSSDRSNALSHATEYLNETDISGKRPALKLREVRYLLISPGLDGKFFTADDFIYLSE